MRLLGSAPKSHLGDQRRRSKLTGLSDLMTLFIDLGCLYCKQTQRAFSVFKNTLNLLKFDSVDQKFNWLECGNFSKDAETPGTERVIAFLQLAVKGLNSDWLLRNERGVTDWNSLDCCLLSPDLSRQAEVKQWTVNGHLIMVEIPISRKVLSPSLR
jgi:hypothetical protein